MNTQMQKSNSRANDGVMTKDDVERLKMWALALAIPAAFGGVSFWLFREHGRSKTGR